MRSAQPPELRIETEVVEDRLGFVAGEAAPVGIELVLVPRVCESGRLLDREDR